MTLHRAEQAAEAVSAAQGKLCSTRSGTDRLRTCGSSQDPGTSFNDRGASLGWLVVVKVVVL